MPKSKIARGVPLACSAKIHVPKPQIARGVPLRFSQISDSKAVNRRGCPPKFSLKLRSQSHISQGVSPYVFPQIQVPKSKIARGVPLECSAKIHVPKPQIARGVPLRFSQISDSKAVNRKGCPPTVFLKFRSQSHPTSFSKIQVPKSKIARGVHLRLYLKFRCQNHKSQGVSP